MKPILSLQSLTVAAVLAISACSPAPAPVSRSPHDPSNPAAPEGAAPEMMASAVAPLGRAHAEHEHEHEHGGDEAAVYACPMHPEVTSSAPGVCPKCNMKLVPKD